MFFFIIILFLFVVAGLKVRKNWEGVDVLSYKDTTTINGIFVICILISHSTQYFPLTNTIFDRLELCFQNFHNQWVVATFLAFSGYGVMTRILISGESYLKQYPVNRILKTLIHFDLAIFIYVLVNIVTREKYSILTIFLSLLGVKSIGNSNWYVFVILLMYTFTYIAAIISNYNLKRAAGWVTFLSIIYIIIMNVIRGESRFFSTVMCYPLGIWIAIYKNRIIKYFADNKILSFLILSGILLITYKLRWNDYIMNVSSCVFVMLVIWFNTLFEIRSNVLLFIGKHAFSIYILQRIPMILICKFLPEISNINVIGAGVSFAIIVVIVVIFDKFLRWFDKKVFD